MDAKLKSFVARIESIEDEVKEVGTSKRDVFEEAAKAGYDKKALRRVLRDRKEAAKDKGTADLAERYRELLGMPGATYRSVAEQTGGKRSTIHRLVPRKENGTTPHDPETGEIKETATSGGAHGHRSEPSSPAEQSVKTAPSPERVSLSDIDGEGERPGTHSPTPAEALAILNKACPAPDDLTLPPHLDRRTRAGAQT